MKRTIAALWRYNRNELWYLPALTLGCWLLVETVTWFVVRYDTTAHFFPAGTAAALYGSALFATVLHGIRLGAEYSFLLQFPFSRRAVLAAQLSLQLGYGLLGQLTAALLTVLGGPLHRALYGPAADPTPWLLTPWWAWPLTLVLPVLLALFGGGVLQRFGRYGGLVLYFLFMAVCMTTGNWLHPLFRLGTALAEDAPALLAALAAVPAALLLALAGLGVHWLLRAAAQAG